MHPWPGQQDPAVDQAADSAQPRVPQLAVPADAGWRRRRVLSLGEPGGTVTAAVTNATRFTGHVQSLRGVQRGDQVAAQVRVTNGAARLVTIQDPAS